jgi:hypothetical protein
MVAQNGIYVTPKQIAQWRSENAQLESRRSEDERLAIEINERNQRRIELKRKLEAADILSESEEYKEPLVEKPVQETEDSGGSPAFDLVENLRKTGDSLKVKEARKRLHDLGYADKAKHPNYIHGLLFRLVKGGKLVKRGSKYKAAPISSPEGEAEAVGASASH